MHLRALNWVLELEGGSLSPILERVSQMQGWTQKQTWASLLSLADSPSHLKVVQERDEIYKAERTKQAARICKSYLLVSPVGLTPTFT